jgi:hypothetical protein
MDIMHLLGSFDDEGFLVMNRFEQVSEATGISYDGSKPALLFGGSVRGMAEAAEVLEESGVRLVDRLSVAEGLERLSLQPALGLAWLELEAGDLGPDLERMLDHLEERAVAQGTAVVASVPQSAELVDLLAARLTHHRTEILIEPDQSQRVAALAVVHSGILGSREKMFDATKDNAARLRQLSDEMGRIAATLARLSTAPGGEAAVKPAASGEAAPPLNVEVVRSVIRARRLRARYFSEELFADPAWDMLLDLLQAELAQLRVPVSSLCIAAAVPATTALRWIKTMTEQGLFLRRADPHDGRRVFVELAPVASEAMRRYFADVGKPVAV